MYHPKNICRDLLKEKKWFSHRPCSLHESLTVNLLDHLTLLLPNIIRTMRMFYSLEIVSR